MSEKQTLCIVIFMCEQLKSVLNAPPCYKPRCDSCPFNGSCAHSPYSPYNPNKWIITCGPSQGSQGRLDGITYTFTSSCSDAKT